MRSECKNAGVPIYSIFEPYIIFKLELVNQDYWDIVEGDKCKDHSIVRMSNVLLSSPDSSGSLCVVFL